MEMVVIRHKIFRILKNNIQITGHKVHLFIIILVSCPLRTLLNFPLDYSRVPRTTTFPL